MRALFSPSYPASSNPIFELFLARSCEVWAIAPISILGYIYVTRLNYGHKRKRNEAKDGLARCSMPLTLQETVNPNIPASSSLVLIFYQLELAHTHTHTHTHKKTLPRFSHGRLLFYSHLLIFITSILPQSCSLQNQSPRLDLFSLFLLSNSPPGGLISDVCGHTLGITPVRTAAAFLSVIESEWKWRIWHRRFNPGLGLFLPVLHTVSSTM